MPHTPYDLEVLPLRERISLKSKTVLLSISGTEDLYKISAHKVSDAKDFATVVDSLLREISRERPGFQADGWEATYRNGCSIDMNTYHISEAVKVGINIDCSSPKAAQRNASFRSNHISLLAGFAESVDSMYVSSSKPIIEVPKNLILVKVIRFDCQRKKKKKHEHTLRDSKCLLVPETFTKEEICAWLHTASSNVHIDSETGFTSGAGCSWGTSGSSSVRPNSLRNGSTIRVELCAL